MLKSIVFVIFSQISEKNTFGFVLEKFAISDLLINLDEVFMVYKIKHKINI